jgi:choline/glycine/proline betaine transport protein
MSMIATGGSTEPPKRIRIFFALLASVLAIALLITGGLQTLQTAAILSALPFSVVMLMMCAATVTAFSRERRAYDGAQRAQFVDQIGDFYGLEVEEPLLREPVHPVRAALERRRKRAVPAVPAVPTAQAEQAVQAVPVQRNTDGTPGSAKE